MWNDLNSSNSHRHAVLFESSSAPIQLQDFSTWPVQSPGLAALHRQLQSGQVPHALLFVGSAQQTSRLADFVAQLLLCQGTPAPCGNCEGCQQFVHGNHPDFEQVGGDGTVKAELVEVLQRKLALHAHSGRGRVYQLRGLDEMTPVAANRLLKTLEEPEPRVYALLTAQNLRRIMPTLLSRCFVYPVETQELGNFYQWPWEDPLPWGDGGGDSDEKAIAGAVQPMVQWGQSLLQTSKDPLRLANEFVRLAENREISEVLGVLSLWLRDLLHIRVGLVGYVRFTEISGELETQARLLNTAQLLRVLNIVTDTRMRTRSHVAGLLNLEQMCLRIREVL